MRVAGRQGARTRVALVWRRARAEDAGADTGRGENMQGGRDLPHLGRARGDGGNVGEEPMSVAGEMRGG